MYRPDHLQNIAYVWSNTEGLVGDDITFLVARALIKLEQERQGIEKVVEISGRNVIDAVSWYEYPRTVQGQLLVDLHLESAGKGEKTKFYKLALPYRAPIKSFRLGELNPEVKFVHAKKMGGDSLLIEGIICLTCLGYLPWRGKKSNIGGAFTDSSIIKLNSLLPEIKEMVCTQIKFNPFGYSIKDNILSLRGWKEIHLMYIAQESRGERIVVTHQNEPFAKEIELNGDLRSLSYWEINNEKTENYVLGSREVKVVGNFRISGQSVPGMPANSQTGEILKSIKEMTKIIKNKQKNTPEGKLNEDRKTEELINNPPEEMREEPMVSLPENSIDEIERASESETPEREAPQATEEEISAEREQESSPEEEKEAVPLVPLLLEEKKEKVIEKDLEEEKTELTSDNKEGTIIPRQSKREKLSKYMRPLKS
ncbi:MAG: hypothetical protein GXW85_05525 [Clostridia bacterium]|nr:hypothetical protein [Clostridia bacterium]